MGHDLRFALRTILAHRWFSLAIVATLALGIGLNTMVFTLVYAVMYKPVPVPAGSRLVIVSGRNPQENRLSTSYPNFLDYQSETTSFEGLEAGHEISGVISEAGIPPHGYSLEQVSGGLFDMLHVHPILGRGFRATDAKSGSEPVVVLSYETWKERYGGANNVVGRVVRVNTNPATIIGVMPEGFSFPSGVSLWMPLIPDADMQKRSNRSVDVFGVLKPGTSMERANVELKAISQRLAASYSEADKGLTAEATTFNAYYNGPQIDTVFLSMLAAVGFVLLIVCANTANMMLSRVMMRQQEISIRVAIGASRWRVIRQLLIESLVLSVAGGALGFGLAEYGVHWFDTMTQDVGKPTWIIFKIDPTVFAYFAVLCVLAGLISGLAPALRSSRVDLHSTLKEGTRSAGTRRGGLLSGVLVVFQFALTLVLLTGAGIFVRAFLAAQTTNPFVPSGQLMTGGVSLPHERYPDAASHVRFFDQLLLRLRATPGVNQAVISSSLPEMGAGGDRIEIEGQPVSDPLKGPSGSKLVQSPGYFNEIGLPLLRGRDFNETDGNAGKEAAVVTREFASHFWPGQNALGKRFRIYENNKYTPWLTVVGLSADMLQQPNRASHDPLFFVPYRQEGGGGMQIILRASGNPASLALAARAAVQGIDQDLPLFNPRTLSEVIYRNQWFLRLFGGLFSFFALTGLLIASVGIYAVMAQATANRTREIGVRMALGASSGNILRLVLARGMRQLLIGFAIGLAAAYPAARVMTSLPLRVSASDPVLFTAVSVLLIGVGLFACYLPARRAAALDPVKAIRYE
ncbi:MAG: ABC transporter permease [Candidatus Acidiferrales bacterium]